MTTGTGQASAAPDTLAVHDGAVPTGPGAASGPAHHSPRRQLTVRGWRRLCYLALALIVLGAVTGLGVASLVPTQYAARADVLYLLTREQPTGFLREDRNLSTQLVLLDSRAVLEPVATAWEVPVDDLAAALEATVAEESEVVHLQLIDTDPERARLKLEAVVQRYLEVSNDTERSDVQNYLDDQLRQVLTRIDEVRDSGDARLGELGPLVDREQWLRSQLDELALADLAGPGARLLVPPYVGSDPIEPRPLVAAAAGAAAALLVAAALVAVLARRLTRP